MKKYHRELLYCYRLARRLVHCDLQIVSICIRQKKFTNAKQDQIPIIMYAVEHVVQISKRVPCVVLYSDYIIIHDHFFS